MRIRHFFNTTGPCNPDDHYMLLPHERLVGAQLDRYIRNKLYWILHAPRQVGKTTFLQSWVREINAGGKALACYVSVERCQGFNEPNGAMPLIVEAVRKWAERGGIPIPEYPQTDAGSWEVKADYTEAFPHLLLQAFLQRVFNGGGRIERECAAGRGRMDLGLEFQDRRYIIEIKLIRDHDSPQTIREEGLEQISAYRDTYSPDAPAYLLIFDRRPKTKEKSWDERISWEQEGDVTVVGC